MQVNQSKQSDEIEKIWSSEAIGLQNPRALLHLVWSNDVTHLGMQGIKEQHDCQPSDLLLLNGILNTTNAKHRTARGNEGSAKKQQESTTIKCGQWTEESEILTTLLLSTFAIILKVTILVTFMFLSYQSNDWYKTTLVGRNTPVKVMKSIALNATLGGKFTISSGHKTVIQTPHGDFDYLLKSQS